MSRRYNGPASHFAHQHAQQAAEASSSHQHDKVASASTALDRVLGLLDGFEDDMDCPLCLEEMDISDLNFKPCPCGYQICRFCWNHIKQDLNGKCPACRTPYDEATVEFKAIKPDELKRLQAAKKLRDKKRKEEAATVKNLANVRVRQRAQVHIQGMTTKIANEDTLNYLKGPDQFGQYGKVVKLFMSKRSSTVTQPASTHPLYQPVNVYVNYRTPAEASSCIAAMDGSTTPDGHKIKAIWGTTRYCPTFLKGGKCNNENCMQAHEQGEEIEGAGPTTREEIYTYHAISDSDMQRKPSNPVARKQPEAATLPATASWASKNAINSQPTTPIVINASLPPLSASIKPTPPRPIPVSKPQTHPLPARPSSRAKPESVSSAPAKATPAPAPEAAAPAPTSKASARDTSSAPVASSSTASTSQPLSAPPGVPVPVPAPELAYTNGNLVNGSRIVRPPSGPTFPDLEFGEGTFSFSLDLDVKGKGRASPTPGLDDEGIRSPLGSNSDFGRPRSTDPFGLDVVSALSPALSTAPSYFGSFDPFSDGSALDTSSDPHSGSSSPPLSAEDLSRRGSRFGFARRGSQGVRGGDLASALARSAFASGRESPSSAMFPPGMPFPQQHRPPSSVGFSPLPPPPEHQSDSSLWSGANLPSASYTGALPPGMLRNLASPGASATSSPQISPRLRAGNAGPYGSAPPGVGLPPANGATPTVAATSLPPGISLGRAPIPAAQFPLPPPAPRPSGQQAGTVVGKEDILALIAAAQSSAPKQQPQQQTQDAHPFFSDPAILSARLPSSNGGGSTNFSPNGMVGLPTSAAYHSLDGGMAPQHQGYNLSRGGAFPPGGPNYGPPGVRPLQAYGQYRG
ncbi:CCR4-NOT transcription complex subunit 4 [Pseudohyphozyma bogoriensis]|nr:CCR4-NOT transcription complex subunit 4 [Pseudohyphozyma bogoriensis]